mmetsp:Transcript_13853/g.20968  ORF Transcript_13853/g.20968 Transcript_13853/m.20968 type:complete len:242 (+) Transcript_13853:34-759(+)
MSDSEWDSDAASDEGMMVVDDWEEEDVPSEDEDDIRARKNQENREAEERKKYKEMEKEIRERLLAEGALSSKPKAGKFATKNTGMFKKYNEVQSDYSLASDLIQADGSKIQIELLEPQTKGDFKDYTDLMASLLQENSESKHFKSAFLDLITKVTDRVDYSVKDLKLLVSHCESLITLKNNEKKNPTEKKKVYSKKVVDEIEAATTQGDMFAAIQDENAPDTQEEGEESEGSEFDSDDDFM